MAAIPADLAATNTETDISSMAEYAIGTSVSGIQQGLS